MTIEQIMSTHLHFKQRANMRSLYPSTMPLWSVVQGAQESESLKKVTEEGRAVKATGDTKAYGRWKAQNLISVYIGVKFGPGGKPDIPNVTGYTGLAGFDFDDVENPVELVSSLTLIPEIVCASVSISGTGVWCIGAVGAGTATEYTKAFARGIQTFIDFGLTGMDLGAHDPTRGRFISYYPEIWWRWDAEGEIPQFPPDGDISVLKSEKSINRIYSMPEDYNLSPEVAYDAVRMEFERTKNVPDGEMNNEKARQCGILKALIKRGNLDPQVVANGYIAHWDALGSTGKKTRSMANRLLLADIPKEMRK